MPVNIPRLRYWFAVAAISLVLVVAGFYLYPRLKHRRNVPTAGARLSGNVQQTTTGFSLSKSEGGHTLFTVRAAKATTYSDGGRAELKDVNIVIYGRQSTRFDQIYGSDFEYDPQSGNVTAKGVVHIDLQSDTGGTAHPDQAQPEELKNPLHLMAHGLVFNQKTGEAHTNEEVEFRVPQANGSAVGADYDSKRNQLYLRSNVRVQTTGSDPATITARSATISKDPRRTVLTDAHLQRAGSTTDAAEITVFLRDDNSIDHILGSGGITAEMRGQSDFHLKAPQAVLYLTGQKNDLTVADVSGGAQFEAAGASTMHGSADKLHVTFTGHNDVKQVRAEGKVKLVEPPKPSAGPGGHLAQQPKTGDAGGPEGLGATKSGAAGQTVEVAADAMDFYLDQGQVLRRAETSGNAEIVLTPENSPAGLSGPPMNGSRNSPPSRTVVTAKKFYATFENNRINLLTGLPDAKVVAYTPGEPDKVSTSRMLEVSFDATGQIGRLVQRDDFHYAEHLPNGTERGAWADLATYTPQDETLVLNGHPRVVEAGMTSTARMIRIDRAGNAAAQDQVKTTYSELQPQPGGALLAGGDPIHVTARAMTAQRGTGIARYSGDARLWQAANVIEAPVIDFNRDKRTVTAYADGTAGAAVPHNAVKTLLVQQDRSGKLTPVNITSARLTYADNQRLARFEGGVNVRGADGTLTAKRVDVYLKAAASGGGTERAAKDGDGRRSSAAGTAALQTPSQVERIVAEGDVLMQQPGRRGTGQKLVYTAAEEKFVLTGGPPSGPPNIFDAEHGTTTGNSLTFYSRDDRVLIQGGPGTRTVTTTRVSK